MGCAEDVSFLNVHLMVNGSIYFDLLWISTIVSTSSKKVLVCGLTSTHLSVSVKINI